MSTEIRWRKVVGGVLLGLFLLTFVGILVGCIGLQGALIVTGASILIAAIVMLAAYLLTE